MIKQCDIVSLQTEGGQEMSKITTEEFYRGDKYNVTYESFKLYWKEFKNSDKDEVDDLFFANKEKENE